MVKRYKEEKMKGTFIAIIVLSVLLVGALGFIGYNYFVNAKVNRETLIYQTGYKQGATEGYSQAVFQIMQLASKCEAVPLKYENQTMELVWVNCLNPQV